MNEHWLSGCPSGMCVRPRYYDHTLCKALLARQIKRFVKTHTGTIDPMEDYEDFMDNYQAWHDNLPAINTLMDDGTRVYHWRAERTGDNEWAIVLE
jgi:hypothetical protein